jgi:hypothetical protein
MRGWFAAIIAWLNTNGGALTALVTAIYAVFTILLWVATRRQASLTREIFEATHRPHISIKPRLHMASHPGYVRLDFELMNNGSSPAIVTQCVVNLVAGEADLGGAEISGSWYVAPGEMLDATRVELHGAKASWAWGDRSHVTIEAVAEYRGPSQSSFYQTRMSGQALITEPHTLMLRNVEHEVR